MTSARLVLVYGASMALGRFIYTPTWPCALVALVALAALVACEVVARSEAEHARLKEERSSSAERMAQQLASVCQSIVELEALAKDVQARAERLEANRALGG